MKKRIQDFIKKDICIITTLFLLSRLVLLFFLFNNNNINIYDVNHYISIAKNGYIQESLYAFFPLYPLLIRLFHYIIPSYEISALLLSNLCSFISTIVLYNMIENKKQKILTIILFLFSPILVFNTIGYTESLYLLLTISSFYLYKKKKYIFCGLLIGLSIITRNTGLILLGAIGLDMLYNIYKKENTIKELILLSIIPIGIALLFHAYLYVNTQDAFKYVTVQYTEWHKENCNLITLIIKDIQYMIKEKSTIYVFIQNWLFYFIGLYYGIKYIKKEKVLSIYMIVSLLLFVTMCRNSSWVSLPSLSLFRYVFSLFPIYILQIIDYKKKTTIFYLILYLSFAIANSILIYKYGVFIA